MIKSLFNKPKTYFCSFLYDCQEAGKYMGCFVLKTTKETAILDAKMKAFDIIKNSKAPNPKQNRLVITALNKL